MRKLVFSCIVGFAIGYGVASHFQPEEEIKYVDREVIKRRKVTVTLPSGEVRETIDETEHREKKQTVTVSKKKWSVEVATDLSKKPVYDLILGRRVLDQWWITGGIDTTGYVHVGIRVEF